MKKLFVGFGLATLFVMSGCSAKMDMVSCSNKTTSNGITTEVTYDIYKQKDDVKKVKITYDYTDDTTNMNNGSEDTNNTDTDNNATDNNNDSRTTREKQDGVNSDTDGLSEDKDSNKNLESNDVVDGVVGDAIDSTIDGVTDTILDLAGIRTTYSNQISTYGDIKGFSYKIDKDVDHEYKIIYEIDMDKISDTDLSKFNVPTKDFSDLKKNYQDLGYRCK